MKEVAEAINNLAYQVRQLGNGDAYTGEISIGAIEGFSMKIGEYSSDWLDILKGIAESFERIATSLEED